MNKSERIDIRITEELKEKLTEAAEKENRSISNFIINLIKRELENENHRN